MSPSVTFFLLMLETQLSLPFGVRKLFENVTKVFRKSLGESNIKAPDGKLETWKHGITLKVMRHPRARRYLLRLEPDGVARLVIPRRGSRREAFLFLKRNESWLLRRYQQWQVRTASRTPWADGTGFLFRGESVTLRVEEHHATTVRLRFANEIVDVARGAEYRPAILAHLRAIAEKELPPRTRELARVHGITISRVTIRGQKTRWGSCSARGTISLNWRLIHAPSSVQDYLIIHELMHRREMNHSARYWKLVATAFPEYEAAEKWLKRTRLETMD